MQALRLNTTFNQPSPIYPKSPLSSTSQTAPIAFKHAHRCEEHEDPSGGHGLGRDDPLWPCYVKEAEKWDDILMKKWNE